MTTIHLPGITGDDDRTLNLLLARIDAKMARNKLRADYYDMKRVARFLGWSIPGYYQQLRIVLGWAGKSVDLLARRCRLDSFVWPDGDLDSIGYQDVWDGNLLGSTIQQGQISSLIHATAFVVTSTGSAGEPPAMVHFQDAMNASGEWNVRARRLDSLLSINGRDGDGNPSDLALYLDGRTITAVKSGNAWSVSQQRHGWGVPAEPLPYKPRLGRPFGSSRISRAVMSYQDMAMRSAVRLEAHSDIYAMPDVWLLGADESIFSDGNGVPTRALQTAMGRIKGIPDDDDASSDALARAEVRQFPSADPEPHLKALRQVAQWFSGETSIPLTSLGVSDMSNPTSADSYIASREDLISEAEGTTDDWAPFLQRAMVRALAMANGLSGVPSSWRSIQPKWRSPIYQSRAQQADAGSKQVMAAPWLAETTVGLELIGLTPQQIERAQGERRRSAGMDLLAGIGQQQQDSAQSQKATDDATVLKTKFDALGVAIRAGVKPEVAAAQLGLSGISFAGLQPVSLRDPNAVAG